MALLGHSATKNATNACKYVTSITVIALSFAGSSWHQWWVAVSILSTVLAFTWDVVVDWGLGPAAIRRVVYGENWYTY